MPNIITFAHADEPVSPQLQTRDHQTNFMSQLNYRCFSNHLRTLQPTRNPSGSQLDPATNKIHTY